MEYKPIEASWEKYVEMMVGPIATDQEKSKARQAFFSGAAVAYFMLTRIGEKPTTPEDFEQLVAKHAYVLEAIDDEIETFKESTESEYLYQDTRH